jgi:NADH-quinone oxidoreductase subunit J
MILFLFFLLNLTSSLVFTVYNPVYAAFFLIMTFFLSATSIWILNSSFFALIYIIIYVGAIAVLFLFVIMMLEIKAIDSIRLYDFNRFNQAMVYLIFFSIPFIMSFILASNMLTDNFLDAEENNNSLFDSLFGLQTFGQVIYNYYVTCILLGGLILLVAILGAVTLTLSLDRTKQIKLPERQLSRSENFLSFFK